MIFIVVLSILVLVSLIGNTLVILTVLINKPMQTTLNYLLVNLAVADILFALCISMEYVIMPFITHPEGETGRYLCTLVTGGDLAWVGGAVSILCLVYIAVERYFAIIHPLRQRGRFTKRRLKMFIVVAWIVAILVNIPDIVQSKYYQPDLHLCESDGSMGYMATKVNSLVWMVLAGIVPVCIMVYLYSIVVHRLWFKPVENLEASQKAVLRYRKGVTITLIAVSVIFAISWIPNLAAYVIYNWGLIELVTWFDNTGIVLLTFNSCVNPVLYSMRMKRFRDHLRDMLLCKKRQRGRVQAAEVCGGSTTGQPTNGTEDAATPTRFSLSSELNQEMVSLNFAKSWRESWVISGTTANMENIETTTAVSESKEATAENSLLQENVKTEDTSSALYEQLLYIGTLKTKESPETRESKETLPTSVNTGAVKRMEAAGMLLSSSFTDSTTTGTAATSPGTRARSENRINGHCELTQCKEHEGSCCTTRL